jgi:hypothetical protein
MTEQKKERQLKVRKGISKLREMRSLQNSEKEAHTRKLSAQVYFHFGELSTRFLDEAKKKRGWRDPAPLLSSYCCSATAPGS